MLEGVPRTEHPNLVVGPELSDDAGVYRLPGGDLLVQTVDLITPLVDDPFVFGEIAAANALSDVYAMGGRPLTALSILGFPSDKVPMAVAREILRGAIAKVREADAVVVGGHTTDDHEIKFGLAVSGIVEAEHLTPNSGAKPGDLLVLTKPLGTGIVATAFKRRVIDEDHPAHRAMIEHVRTLNRAAAEAARLVHARAVTDVTGFGLGGHTLEMAIASQASVELWHEALPLLPEVLALATRGLTPGGTARNAEAHAAHVEARDEWRAILFDPQTSGGLLIAASEDGASTLCEQLPGAVVIGRVDTLREPRLRLTAAPTEALPPR